MIVDKEGVLGLQTLCQLQLGGGSSNWQEQGSSPSGNSQMIQRSQAAGFLSPRNPSQEASALLPRNPALQAAALLPRTRGQQAAASSSPRTRSQAAALSPMTRSQAAAAGRQGRSQQERHQERQQERQQHERQHERQQQTPPMTTRTSIERDLGNHMDELEFEASRREDNNRTGLTTIVRRRLEMDDQDGLTTTKSRKVSQEFMHDKVVKELLFPSATVHTRFVGSWPASSR